MKWCLALLYLGSFSLTGQKIDSVLVYMQQYQYEKVLVYIDTFFPDNKSNEICLIKGTALKALKKYQEAVPNFLYVFQSDSTNIQVIINLAECYNSLNDYKEAQYFYRKGSNLQPENNYFVQQLADSYYANEQYNAAKEYYNVSLKKDTVFYLVKQIAKCLDNSGKADSAILYYECALELNPDDFQSVQRLANLYIKEEDYEKGIKITDFYLLSDSGNVKILRLSGYINFLLKNYIKAAERFYSCIQLGDTSTFVNKYLGYSYFKLKEYAEAKDYLEIAFIEDSLNADLCYALGLSCSLSYYKKLGIDYLEKAIELIVPPPESLSRIYQDLALAHTGYYQYKEALDAYFKAFDLMPDDTLLIFSIASHYDNWIKDKYTALKYYKIFMKTRPKQDRSLPVLPVEGGLVVSYYDFTDRRIKEIEEEIFWTGEQTDTVTLK
ncbi:MAG: hypothetical protein JXJ22_12155 [Bacteroidales bacterium]|nr:hypothetical protein [Bacteroidales bacterium]